ncbi:hypothetical protein SM11_pC1126 (plasmid) [Sinorhizobium meliloti SM11]|uniref:Uncharacterized protein n=1 Tax=Sinorhizobium meliloti (strain SM11) TaxID=707241 RepID=F7XF74_SINMM|nr:hypothetical protein SM11_pC1126 [Sinorhizobium meliloti SM11]
MFIVSRYFATVRLAISTPVFLRTSTMSSSESTAELQMIYLKQLDCLHQLRRHSQRMRLRLS